MAASGAIVFALFVAAAAAAAPLTNMNGLYKIANPNVLSGNAFSSDYGSKNAEFMDVYSPEISSTYGHVFWTMMPDVPLDPALVQRFANKTMAIIGYEVDQVFKTPNGDESIPIYWQYNHHYEAFLLGANTELVEVDGTSMSNMGRNHGSTKFYQAQAKDGINEVGGVPTSQYFSEGNGGEFRKSFHGYPKGYAQLIHSPATFRVQPMQIDTRNREYNGTGFKPWYEPRSSGAPPNASYSGLLECPCTTRTVKQWNTTYATQSQGTCGKAVASAEECVTAVTSLGQKPTITTSVSTASLPYGCLVVAYQNGTLEAVFNDHQSSTNCDVSAGAKQFFGQVSSAVNMSVELDSSVPDGLVTITISGPADVWFGVGFSATSMADQPYTIIVDGYGNVTERKIGDHSEGTPLSPTQVKMASSKVDGGIRTVVLTRAFKGATANHYTFSTATSNIPFINAIGSTPALAFHKFYAASTLVLKAVNTPTCVCNQGTHGTINGIPFPTSRCAPEPTADLLQQNNPTCHVETYAGGQLCCHHNTYLLDADQPLDNRTMEFHLKFRFWFQEYVSATPSTPASHQDLPRFYFQTEAYASEYDIVPCNLSEVSPADCVQEITARFQVSMMAGCSKSDPSCYGHDVQLIYAGGHCHAPACISLELYNMDTGQLLCRQLPVFGQGQEERFDEPGYLALPPCLWGSPEEGLEPPVTLHWDTNLLSIKRNNNTNGHYGEMASWQMRGVFL